MIDLKILTIQDILTVHGVEFLPGVSPLSLLITGDNLNEASRILINDVESPEHVIVSSTRVMAQVPSSETRSILRKLVVLAERPSSTRSSLLSFELKSSMRTLQGIERLVQLFCKLCLQTPGSDKFNPAEGGGLLSLIGSNISRHEVKGLQASIVGAISRTRDQILARQSRNNRIPADERLLSAQTDAVGFDPSSTTTTARVAIAAVSGRQAVANLTF